MSTIHELRPWWEVPREWAGQTAFVICSGPSVDAQQRETLRKLKAKGCYRFIAVKHSVEALPDADVMIVGNKEDPSVLRNHFKMFTGERLVARTLYEGMPEGTLYLRRHKSIKDVANGTERMPLSTSPKHLAGLDTGASAINLAFLFGAKEIVVAGMDMKGGHWMKHHLQTPPGSHHHRHMRAIESMASDLKAHGVPVWNASPDSALKCWPKRKLEEWL